ncbi:MAG: GNAT family N-acetyltransferase [Candidatus Eisenbacteria bacterium]|nr:GNAT family N-acetyltransferase [Candidatus Eisenbacteria bacterium]
MNALTVPPSPVPHLRTIEITPEHEATLQRFFEANPEYYLISNGEPAGPDEAHKEIHDDPPAEWGFTKKWLVGWLDDAGEMVAMANVVSDLLAPRVWHIGYFLVATSTYGTGLARTLYASLERWMQESGADWLRLGVIVGNVRAERFWASLGFLETRVRDGVVYGKLTHSISVRVKPLEGGTVEEYLARVPRDRPDGPA